MNTGCPGHIVFPSKSQASCQRDGVFHTLRGTVPGGWKKTVRRITDLHNSAAWGNPARLRLTPHEFEVVDLILGCCLDQSIREVGPTVNRGRGLKHDLGSNLVRPGLNAASAVLV
jgi:hypothetical protein